MHTEKEYLKTLEAQAQLPPGFRLSTASIEFVPVERPGTKPYRMNLSLLVSDHPGSGSSAGPDASAASGAAMAAGRTTRNRFPGAPVLLARERLPDIRALVVNNRISNVAAPGGVDDAKAVCAAVATGLGLPDEHVLASSTGIIGWRIPVAEMTAAVPDLVAALDSGSALPFARAIMTTDSYPKLASRNVAGGRILGVAKGAGMVEPNLATMLVFFMTDLAIDNDSLERALERAIDRSFNCISVDGDQSTSDTVLILSSAQTEPKGDRWLQEFEAALADVARELAHHVVRNGEGTRHVIRCTTEGLPNEALARFTAKAVVNSPLVKTAIFGNDPNVGRIIMAVGDALGSDHATALGADTVDLAPMRLSVAGRTVFSDGAFRLSGEAEAELSAALRRAALPEPSTPYPAHGETVEIHIQFNGGWAGAEVFGSDLSYDYVRENADYRT